MVEDGQGVVVPAPKVARPRPKLLDMIRHLETEADRLAIWADNVVGAEAREMIEQNEHMYRSIVATLDVVERYHPQILLLIKAEREAEQRRNNKK